MKNIDLNTLKLECNQINLIEFNENRGITRLNITKKTHVIQFHVLLKMA
jgi:hypothetical protein